MGLSSSDLLDGEEVVMSKAANALIVPSEYGLAALSLGRYRQLPDLAGREAIGGKLHLTSWRLIFHSHAVNRATGTFSIFLPTILNSADTSRGFTHRVRIETRSHAFEFVMWGVRRFLSALARQRQACDASEVQHLLQAVRERPEVLSDDLQVSRSVDRLLRGLGMVDAAAGPPGEAHLPTLTSLSDLLSRAPE
jgi:hypothetical protein